MALGGRHCSNHRMLACLAGAIGPGGRQTRCRRDRRWPKLSEFKGGSILARRCGNAEASWIEQDPAGRQNPGILMEVG